MNNHLINVTASIVIFVALSIECHAIDAISYAIPKTEGTQWESVGSGISIALTISHEMNYSAKDIYLNVYIRNDSSSQKLFYPRGQDFGVGIFFLNDQGILHMFHKYVEYPVDATMSLSGEPINSGQTLRLAIQIMPEELKALTQNAVKIRLHIKDAGSGSDQRLDTSPKKITVDS